LRSHSASASPGPPARPRARRPGSQATTSPTPSACSATRTGSSRRPSVRSGRGGRSTTTRRRTASRWQSGASTGGRVLTLTAEYDLSLGVIRVYRDAAGAETRFTWDALSHLIGIAKPGDSEAEPSSTFKYLYGNPTSQVVVSSRIRSGADEFLERHVWYDGLGRQLATVEQAEGGRTLVTGAKTFGRLGRVIEEYEPFFSQGYALVAPQGQFTSHSYDGLGRRRRSVLPDGSSSEHRYAPFAVEHWDAEDLDPSSAHSGTPRAERFSTLGVVQVEERLGPGTLVTRFERDALGGVASVIDAAGNVATWKHDGLGRTVEVNHPDAGLTSFDFDDAGNLRHRTDARGAYVATDYDELGRPLLERLAQVRCRQLSRWTGA